MEEFARLIARNARLVLALLAGVTALLSLSLPLGYDDDVVRFLPSQDPEVQAFDRIMQRFGSLNVALVGVDTTALFTQDNLAYTRRLTETLEHLPEVAHVTSITEMAVIRGMDDAAHVDLVPTKIPSDAKALAAIEANVLSLDYFAGTLVSTDGTAAMLIAQLRTDLPDGSAISSKRAAERVKEAATSLEAPPGLKLHFGGAPFIAEAAVNGSQEDLKRLAPFVVIITLLLVIVSLGSMWAALFTVIAVGMSILWTMGIMGWLGLPLTLVSTTLPVLLVALGSAYAVHVLVWYREHDADVIHTIVHMGWPVVVTGLTTMAGFLSFLVMDLVPMREFGWQMAMGTGIAALLALTLVPALLVVKPIAKRAHDADKGIDRWLVRVALAARRRRWPLLAVAGAVAVLLSTRLGAIDTRMDTDAFFERDSAPSRADTFLTEKFGGSTYLQVLIDADLHSPAVQHRLAAFEDRLQSLDGVTRIQSISRVLAIVHEGLKSTRRPSRSREEIEQMGFLARRSDPSVGLLVDEAWRGSLLQVAIGGFDTDVVDDLTRQIRALARSHLAGGTITVARSAEHAPSVHRDAAQRILSLAGHTSPADALLDTVIAVLEQRQGVTAERLTKPIAQLVELEIVEDEMITLAEGADTAGLVNRIVAELGAARLSKRKLEGLLRAVADPAELRDGAGFDRAARYIFTQIERVASPLAREAVEAGLWPLLGSLSQGAKLRVQAIVDELLQPQWYVHLPQGDALPEGAQPITVTVSGQPVIQRAMTNSVQRNQALSVSVGLPLVFVILVVVFRSVIAGFVGVLPAGLTLLVTFGLMGLFPEELPMDIGASMLASIALGVGIDYAIHFMWRYRTGGLEAAMRTTGRAILINAGEITGGFIVLAWASIAPMSRFGVLTAQTLLVAAVATLVLLPPLLSFWRLGRPGAELQR